MAEHFDLFGDPVPENWGGRGRPPHIATNENRNKVNMLLAAGWNNDRIAGVLRITLPTFRKYYFAELKFRDVARDRLNAELMTRCFEEVRAGNVTAMRTFVQLLERNDLMTFGQAQQPETKREAKLGKKEAALIAAHEPDSSSVLGALMAQRQSDDGRPN